MRSWNIFESGFKVKGCVIRVETITFINVNAVLLKLLENCRRGGVSVSRVNVLNLGTSFLVDVTQIGASPREEYKAVFAAPRLAKGGEMLDVTEV